MAFRLREGVHYCVANGDLAFLDLKADRYFCLPKDQERILADWFDRGASAPCPTALEPLVARGLIVGAVESCQPSPVRVGAASSDLAAPPGGSVIGQISAVLSRRSAVRELRTKPVSAIIASVRAAKAQAIQAHHVRPVAELMPDLGAYLSSRWLMPTHDHCLSWSLAMIRFLACRHCYPDLVIGVRMRPFEAHAWVQEGSVVISDPIDSVRPFTPILVA